MDMSPSLVGWAGESKSKDYKFPIKKQAKLISKKGLMEIVYNNHRPIKFSERWESEAPCSVKHCLGN